MAGSSRPSPHSRSEKVLTPKCRNIASSSRCHSSCASEGRGRGGREKSAEADERGATRAPVRAARKDRREGMPGVRYGGRDGAKGASREERAEKSEPKTASRKLRTNKAIGRATRARPSDFPASFSARSLRLALLGSLSSARSSRLALFSSALSTPRYCAPFREGRNGTRDFLHYP